MNFKKHLGLMLINALSLSVLSSDLLAGSAPAGQMRTNAINKDCPTGCYCIGGPNITFLTADVKSWCKDAKVHWAESKESTLHSGGIFKCAHVADGSFKESDSNSKNADQCFKEVDNYRVYNKTIRVDRGYALKGFVANDNALNLDWSKVQPVDCKYEFQGRSEFDNAICPGGDVNVTTGGDELGGVERCATGKIPTEDRKSCMDATVECDPGEYLPKKATSCSQCKDGYKCIGGEFEIPASKDQGIEKCPSGYKSNADYTDCEKEKTTVECVAGKYVPANTLECQPCKEGYYCPDRAVYHEDIEDQGALLCEYTVSDDRKKCQYSDEEGNVTDMTESSTDDAEEETKITVAHCAAGYYLPAGATVCTICPEDSYCTGGNYNVSDTIDRGITKCATGMASKPGSNTCEKLVLNCEPGKWLPAGKKACEYCTGASYFCPGGEFEYSDKSQGRLFCAFDGIVDANHESCHIVLSREQMAYGPAGETAILVNQCWTRINAEAYRYCILGDGYEELFNDITQTYYDEYEE